MAKARLAYLVKPKKVNGVEGDAVVELREHEIPTPGEGEILVKVEGCGICGTDVHEYRYDPFGMAPVVLGHEGTGEVVAIGEGVKFDTKGDPIKVGDKVVTSVLLCNECDYCRRYPELPNLCENLGVYGLIPEDDVHFNGWFAEYILVRKNSSIFVVNDMTLDERMLIEPACVCVHALARAKTLNIIDFASTVLVQGCGPIGLMQIAVLKAAGVVNIIAVDGVETRLNLAKEMGATEIVNFRELTTIEERVAKVKELTHGFGADFVFQCTGVAQAAADAYKYLRRGGGYCEMGFFVNAGECTMNPHFDLCNKEINLVGSWVYSANEYITTLGFLKKAKEMNIPVEKLVTHHYTLDQYVEAMEKNISLTGIKIAICPE
ncbi:MAG: zinc-binding dehydrogenase [Clostridia bacterium]|nr:zinc-binding dehydrogenase [Clostridia bacterium]